MIIAATGHRPDKLGGYTYNGIHHKIFLWFCEQLELYTPELVISGMALGVDQLLVKAALNLNIPFEAAIPFKGQESCWPYSSQEIYRKYLNKAHKITYVSSPGYSSAKMQRRNEYMVDTCDLLLGVYDGTLGGTANCIKYAKSKEKKILIYNPKELIND